MSDYALYMHRNKLNGKVYVGITSQGVDRRWRYDGQGYKKCVHFYRAIQKHGWDNFEHIVIREGLSKSEAEHSERKLIASLDATHKNKGYNIALGGSTAGKHSKETREKISKKNKMRDLSYQVQKMREANLGRTYSEEHCRNISKAQKGRKFTQEHKEAIRQAKLGSKLTEEHKAKIRHSVAKTKGTKKHRELVSKIMREVHKNNPEINRRVAEMNRKPVMCTTTGEVFMSVKEAARKYNLKYSSGITDVCRGRVKSAGKLEDGTRLSWEYYQGGRYE